jgi:branched-chain amino acid transport system permease protein
LLLGVPTLRLRADYLAIVTIAAAEIVRQIARSATFNEWLGGSDGITGKFGKDFFDLNPFKEGLETPILRFNANDLWVVITGWALVAIIIFVMWLMVNSPWGRLMRAIREDEDAVRSLGKNVYHYKMQSLIIGGVIGSIGGFVYALSRQSVQPDNYGTALTFFAYTVLILGGAARVFSPIVGAMIFWFLIVFIEQVLRQAVTNNLIPDWLIGVNQVGQIRFMLMGIGLMLLMIFRPQGIFGDKKELALDAKA